MSHLRFRAAPPLLDKSSWRHSIMMDKTLECYVKCPPLEARLITKSEPKINLLAFLDENRLSYARYILNQEYKLWRQKY